MTTAAPASVEDDLRLSKASFADLPNWSGDSVAAALPALHQSCITMMRVPKVRPVGPDGIGGTHADWFPACEDLVRLIEEQNGDITDQTARDFFEQHFNLWQVSDTGGDTSGLFTGYYEPLIRASRTRGGDYQTPVHARPDDMVSVTLSHFLPGLEGKQVTGKVVDGRLVKYDDRATIARKGLEGRAEAIVWADSAIDVFFLEIQGSGRALLDTGETIRLGYAAQNGHRYHAIGKTLLDRGEATRDEMSMPFIRNWLETHPKQAQALMNRNPSYVFFEEQDGPGPLGAQGVPLTAGRSLAVDRFRMPYGAPVFLDASHPVEGQPPLQRLMIAQDTGGAIRGAVRGDVFWGFGPEAEQAAGLMKSRGRYWLMLPASVDPHR
ncbi:MAG: murein transglycosylase A [Alphaproteobacteria bacterium]